MRNSLTLLITGAVLLAATTICQGDTDGRTAMMVRIVEDRALWGEDFYRLLASLPSFQKAGEQRLQVFADRVVGTKKHGSLAEAERGALSLDRTLQSTQDPALAAAVRRRFQAQRPVALKPTAIQFVDDGSYRVAALEPDAHFLPPGLKIATVLERLGKAERVTTEVLDDGRERRPVILTIYHFAGGAIAFAEADVAPRPGLVSRVFIDVPALTSALREATP